MIRIVLTGVIFAGVIFSIMPCLAQEDMRVVDNSEFVNAARPPALFDHDAHNEAAQLDDCAICHHLYENGVRIEGESSEDQSCAECHSQVAGHNRLNLRRAFHIRCKGCHLASNAGPVMCAECHVRGSGVNIVAAQ